MITADQIPDEVVRAAGEAFLKCDSSPSCSFDDAIRAAIAATISAWPGARWNGWYGPSFMLPLPQEGGDA